MKGITSIRHLILYSLVTVQVSLYIFALVMRFGNLEFREGWYVLVALFLGIISYLGILLWCSESILTLPKLTHAALRFTMVISIFWILLSLAVATPAVR